MRAGSGDFLDSNVLIYAFTDEPKADAALVLLDQRPIISVQGLNEFVHVGRRKLGMDWQQVREAVEALRELCPIILAIEKRTQEEALRIAERYGYSIFDSCIVASALEAGSDILWSEDMHHGMVIDGRLRIANPFRTES
jgi:predicted nucleic acid-binding protein